MYDINPLLLEYSQKENRITELLFHTIHEAGLGRAFAGFLTGKAAPGPNHEPEIGLQLQGEFPDEVRQAIVIGISKDGELYPTESGGQTEGRPDAYLYFRESQELVLVEMKVDGGSLGEDQLNRHQGVKPSASFLKPRTCTWAEVIRFMDEALDLATTGSKSEYVLRNFVHYARVEALGGGEEVDTFLLRCGIHRHAAADMHRYLIGKGHVPEFNTPGSPHTLEYRIGTGRRCFAIDLLQHRYIIKFGNSKYKEHMEGQVEGRFGERYRGTHSGRSTEANVKMALVDGSNVGQLKELFEYAMTL